MALFQLSTSPTQFTGYERPDLFARPGRLGGITDPLRVYHITDARGTGIE